MPAISNSPRCDPLLKWPGGKRALIDYISQAIPASFKRYYEPFAGGGALFFAIRPSEAVLGDINPELVNCYVQVRDDPERVIDNLRRLKNTKADYYRVRASKPRTEAGQAARTIYLTTLAFNGIYRLNLAGVFNVPYGFKTHLQPCNALHIRACSAALKKVVLRSGDFSSTLIDAAKGDLVYLDPPYTVAHGLNGFVKYNERIFSWSDQERLSELAGQLANRGCTVIVSNADHASVRKLYSRFERITISRHSVIAAASQHRRQITECMFVGGPDAR